MRPTKTSKRISMVCMALVIFFNPISLIAIRVIFPDFNTGDASEFIFMLKLSLGYDVVVIIANFAALFFFAKMEKTALIIKANE